MSIEEASSSSNDDIICITFLTISMPSVMFTLLRASIRVRGCTSESESSSEFDGSSGKLSCGVFLAFSCLKHLLGV